MTYPICTCSVSCTWNSRKCVKGVFDSSFEKKKFLQWEFQKVFRRDSGAPIYRLPYRCNLLIYLAMFGEEYNDYANVWFRHVNYQHDLWIFLKMHLLSVANLKTTICNEGDLYLNQNNFAALIINEVWENIDSNYRLWWLRFQPCNATVTIALGFAKRLANVKITLSVLLCCFVFVWKDL